MEWRLFADLAALGGSDEVEIDVEIGDSVDDALAALVADRPALRRRVLDDDGGLVDYVTVLVDGSAVTDADLQRPLDGDEELALLPPMSGG